MNLEKLQRITILVALCAVRSSSALRSVEASSSRKAYQMRR